ncbi:MAG: hypothetical protein L6Q95_06540 [Planctomycetes bacterium]|nr:hypothetical protein [Planctomycetota bacterium]
MTRAALLLLLALAAACGQRYRVNETAQNVPHVFLREVKTGGDETTLTLRVEADAPCEVGVAPPGDAAAFRLVAGERTLPLTEVSGVEELPGLSDVDARGSIKFRLTFEALPEGAQSFVAEGEIAGVGPVTFVVRLDGPNVVKCGW